MFLLSFNQYFSKKHKHFNSFESIDFLQITEHNIKPMYHCICLMWALSKYYGRNSRMIILFRMINNLMIEAATKSLDPGSLFVGEPDESIQKLSKIIAILEIHRDAWIEYRDRLSEFVREEIHYSPIFWTFQPKEIFERFDAFTERLCLIREIFQTANEFLKLEKIEIGGIKGRFLSRRVQEILEEFMQVNLHLMI